ncbi:hypothetical protein HNQ94_001823 [Salirhabdus euzebyi]|uniref:Uncharacterized protein n=1 Tax=Salirhabdus euzebyi TaxID=394506 RepID=A0A841Q4Q6_9BACI|nr:hypothetical protein [Salirhabdus euzebyi]MBB6453375.1 hypothetical protein [Salirhabdus euzebyi]
MIIQKKLVVGVVGLLLLVIITNVALNSPDLESKTNEDIIKHNYTFVGESENWTAEYRVKGKDVFYKEDGTVKVDSEAQKSFVLKFKGTIEELSTLKTLKYSYDAPGGGGSTVTTFDRPPTNKIFTDRSGGTGVVWADENSIIQVSVEWDNKREDFELTNE